MKFLLCLLPLLLFQLESQAASVTRFAAASSMQFALGEIVDEFRRQTQHTVSITYGSSGNFRRQIMQGAPFELFLSADESYVEALHAAGLTLDAGRVYALGRLALMVPLQSNIELRADMSGLREALERGEISHFAIANPDHAPYGRAAREALQSSKLWQLIQPFLLRAESASQAAQFAISGSSQGGIIPYGLAGSARLAEQGNSVLLSSELHGPIRQRMVLIKGSGEIAQQFYAFLGSESGFEILRRHGFEIPPDE